MRSWIAIAAAAACTLGLAAPGEAQVAYAGKWAAKPEHCKLDQSSPNAPLVLKAGRYDQHEAHCTFAKVEKTGPGILRIKGKCMVEGSSQPVRMTLIVKGDTLTIRDVGTRTLRRCL
jgi:hypothetical protein